MYSIDIKVQRALRLWAIGAITLQMVKNAKASKGKKLLALPKTYILEDGSPESTLFNEATWGAVTHTRMDFIKNKLRPSSLEKVVAKAKELAVPFQGLSEAIDNEDVEMVDLSDDECISF